MALLGSLFTDMAHRDVLSHLLRVASPAIFGAIAQLDRHCAEVARSLKSAKQERWLSPPVSADMPNRWFMHNGRLHGQQTRRYRAANANNHNYILILRCRYEHGLYEEWYNDGQPKLQRNYDAGQLHGPQIEYYVDGMVKSITNYRRVVV